MSKIKNWDKFNETNTYTYTLLNKNDEVVEIEADDIDDANRKVMDLYRGTDPMLTHMNGKLIDWNRSTANFGAMKESKLSSKEEEKLKSLKEELRIITKHLKWCKDNNKSKEQIDTHSKAIIDIKEEIKELKNK
jgi:hypothetical protein